ncbi:MAG: DNA-directed RNA polymerase subunit omega [Thermodesulfobacteriota bacterium]|nr:DNA-directed RNA polymerase subunit omega [Thermodesulfobacteriota bacterium]
MARITVEDCLKNVEDRFTLINLVAKRVKQMKSGSPPLVYTPENKDIVTALREVAAGYVLPKWLTEDEVEGTINEKHLTGDKDIIEDDFRVASINYQDLDNQTYLDDSVNDEEDIDEC